MLRQDGKVSFYYVEHREQPRGVGDTEPGKWATSNLEHFLFDKLSFEDRQGDLGEHYRALLEPQNANSALWQKYGINGFVEFEDGAAIIRAIRGRHPDRTFRLMRREISQTTEVAL